MVQGFNHSTAHGYIGAASCTAPDKDEHLLPIPALQDQPAEAAAQ